LRSANGAGIEPGTGAIVGGIGKDVAQPDNGWARRESASVLRDQNAGPNVLDLGNPRGTAQPA
jgi:hypothetical protein